MSDNFEQYSFSQRPFIETDWFFRGSDLRNYTIFEFRSGGCPTSSYPLEIVIDGYYGDPVEQKITVVPCAIWSDAPSAPMEFKAKLIVLNKTDAMKEVEYTPPPPSHKDGYLFVAKGHGFVSTCPRCGKELTYIGSSSSDWVRHYKCPCGGLLDVMAADICGLDSWEYFEPIENKK